MNRAARLALIALGAGLFALAVRSGFPLCPLAGTFGIPCPGCGLTRATLALLHGDVQSALRFHPLVLLIVPLVAALLAAAAFDLLRDSARPRQRWLRVKARTVSLAAAGILVLTLGVWLARFAGYLGGPVAVTSMRDWLTTQHASR